MKRLIIILSFLPFITKAQPCANNPGMSPETAIPVCGATIFSQNVVPSCTAPFLPSSVCIGNVPSGNAFWYKVHCYQSGTLGFLIAPLNPTDDYNFEVFDITGYAPNDVYANDNLRISLSLSTVAGATGCTQDGVSINTCSVSTTGSQYNLMPFIVAGRDYLVMVCNQSNSGVGYNFSFVDGTAVITDPAAIGVDHVEYGCIADAIRVVFNRAILCSTVTGTGSEFVITSGSTVFPLQSVSSYCTSGYSFISELTINLPAPLSPGNYILTISNGSDANTFKDACGNAVPVGTQVPFTIAPAVPGGISNISFTGCAPTSLSVTLNRYVLCSSLSANASEFSILPGSPVILSAQSGSCGGANSITKTITLALQNPLTSGNYQLVLKNGTDGNTLIDTCGNAMPAASTAFVINQVNPPQIQKIDFDECHPDEIVVNFDKKISCNSLTGNGSEFVINPGNIIVSSITPNCLSGLSSRVKLLLPAALPAGNFTLTVNNGSDGNTISDSCFSFIPVGYSKPFITTQAVPPSFDSVTADKCKPVSVRVYYSKPVKCNSVSVDGSEFFVTGPSVVNIQSVVMQPTCATNNYTGWIELVLSQPVTTPGNYVLHNRNGNDGNGIQDTCSAFQNQAETISFSVLPRPSATFNYNLTWGCTMDTVDMIHPGGQGIVSWLWNFSDNTTAAGPVVSHLFPASTAVASVQLIVSNGVCLDTAVINITLDNAFRSLPALQGTDSVCTGKDISFHNNSTGNNLTYTWDFGDNTNFAGALPPPHIYSGASNYPVLLIAANNHGCKDTGRLLVHVLPFPVVDFTGLKNPVCSNEVLTLNALLLGNIVSYAWDNGDGKTFLNKPRINFSYITEGAYTIKLAAVDKYCGSVEKSRSTFAYKTPVVLLGNDTALCPNTIIAIGITGTSPYQLLWNTGETTPQIITKLISMQYKLIADNNGCKGADSIYITMRSNCLIKVPNVFTPNNDGLNDQLKAINADIDLTKQFSFSIYNRHGNLVFSTNDPLLAWDGKYKGQPVETGTYAWQLTYTDRRDGKQVYEKGTTILIR